MKRMLLGVCVCFFTANAQVDYEEPSEITITISWSPNPEPDIVGYRLFAGQYSGEYLVEMDVGNVTSVPYEVFPAKPYVFALTAYNTSGEESLMSDEASWP